MKKLLLILALPLVYSNVSMAQNEVDALRYSQTTFGGTARYNGMAGSFGALGADMSCMATNPAGMALYRKSDFAFTPGIFSSNTLSTFGGQSAGDSKLNFNFQNIGIAGGSVLNEDKDEEGWKGFGWGLSLSRLANFHSRTAITGYNYNSSMVDYFVNQANASDSLDAFGSQLAWNTYLIDRDTVSGQYFGAIPSAGTLQSKYITTTGTLNETNLSMGGNYNDQLYVGASIGFVRVRFSENSKYAEYDEKEVVNDSNYIKGDFKNFQFNQFVETTGGGMNFKAGFIYRPVDFIRFGMAVHSPTFLGLSDGYKYSMGTSFVGYNSLLEESPEGSFDYRITTPMRAIGSIGVVILKKAVFNVDYEFVDYSQARLRSNSNVFTTANNAILAKYKATGNLRVGGELRLDPLALRAGFAMYGNPYQTGVNKNPRYYYTGGVGYRGETFYMDFAVVVSQNNENYYMYDPTLADPANVKTTTVSSMVTFGWKF